MLGCSLLSMLWTISVILAQTYSAGARIVTWVDRTAQIRNAEILLPSPINGVMTFLSTTSSVGPVDSDRKRS
jgi:hypothetical protein